MLTDLPTQTRRRLETLVIKGERGQWSMDDIDRSQGPKVPRWLPKGLYRSIISQFQYGERMTVELCRRLADELGDPLLIHCVELQALDEAAMPVFMDAIFSPSAAQTILTRH